MVTFGDLLVKNKVVVIFIHSTTHPYSCWVYETLIDEIAEGMDRNVCICTLDSEMNENLLQKMDTFELPIILVHLNGERIYKSVGTIDRAEVIDVIDKASDS